MRPYLLGFRFDLLAQSLLTLSTPIINLATQGIGIPPQQYQPAPELLGPRAEGRVRHVAIEGVQLRLELVLLLVQGVPAVPQDLDLAGEDQAPLPQYGVLPPRVQGAHAGLEVVLGQDLVELRVDLVQGLVELGERRLLRQQPVGDGLESGREGGYQAGRGLIVDGLLPLARILSRRWPVERDACLLDFVVEVVLEYRVRGLRVPFVPYPFDLICDGLLVCGGVGNAMLVLCNAEIKSLTDMLTLRRFAAGLPDQTGA